MTTETRGGSTPAPEDPLRLVRWTVQTGSNARSRGAVVIEAGAQHWEGKADGVGAIDALFRAVDEALVDVLGGHPRVTRFDVHALGEGSEAEGRVIVRVEPPAFAEGSRGQGSFEATVHSANIVAAGIEAYMEALNEMLSGSQWAGAAEAAGEGRADRPAPVGRRGEFDAEKSEHDTTSWFER